MEKVKNKTLNKTNNDLGRADLLVSKRVCIRCKKEEALPRRNICRICKRKQQAKYYAKNKNKINKKRKIENDKKAKHCPCGKRITGSSYQIGLCPDCYAPIKREKLLKHDRERNKKRFKEWAENLTDTYIKGQIVGRTNLSLKDIPQELIELKRAKIMLTRAIYNQK